MSPKEAIQMLERMLDPDPWEDYGLSDKAKEALQVAVDALEKQIPKKPIMEFYVRKNGDVGKKCVCGGFIKDRFFCPHCGQRIDWTEGEG